MQSSKEQFRSLIKSKTAKDVLGENFVLREIGSQEPILKAFEMLQKYNISSMPVFFEQTHKYCGSISLQDVAIVIYGKKKKNNISPLQKKKLKKNFFFIYNFFFLNIK